MRNSIFRRLTPGLLAFLLVVTSGAAFSLDLAPKPSTPMGPSGGHYLGQGNWLANGQHIPAGYYSKPYSIPWSKVGQVGKAALKGVGRFGNAAGLAWTAVQLGKWGYDALNDVVHQNDGVPQEPLDWSRGWWCMDKSVFGSQFSGVRCGATPTAVAFCPHPSDGGACGAQEWINATLVFQRYASGASAPITFRTVKPAGDITNANPYTPNTPVSDDEFGRKMAEAAASMQAQAAFINDPNGNPHRFQEYVDAEQALANQLAQQHQTTVSVNPDPALDPATATGGPDAGTASPDNLPAFCSWAQVVCDFITWMKTEPDIQPVEVPMEEPEFTSGWTSGLGSGSCPAPVSTTIQTPVTYTLEWSFQPLCDLAGLLKPLLLACSAIVAAFIIGGARRA